LILGEKTMGFGYLWVFKDSKNIFSSTDSTICNKSTPKKFDVSLFSVSYEMPSDDNSKNM